MTCREKLAIEAPDSIDEDCIGGCCGCPHHYGYMSRPDQCWIVEHPSEDSCRACWDREIPGTVPKEKES